ncbi:Ketosteroid isomerase-related protein [Caballeronia glathei]|jgi:ketosteroid isomerase-like protein|nr:ketosteroid isomerase-like protein [Paraburkholderia sp. BL8N3]CDY75296.1 Ketosteroid isomerase-related protein [Caballeronia glathei]
MSLAGPLSAVRGGAPPQQDPVHFREIADMANPNAELIERFYRSFQALDAEGMAACYAHDIRFQDPVFGTLHGGEAADMWRMLLARAADFSLTYGNIRTSGQTASAASVATYRFTPTGRTVVNDIRSRFAIRDGLIVEHTDSFDLWRWSRQALGLKGWLFGATPLVQKALRKEARRNLADFRRKRGS